MTSKTKLQSSTSTAAIGSASTANIKLAVDDVPTVGPDHGAADTSKWYDATQRVATSANELQNRSDKASHQTLGMILLDAELHNAEFYKAMIKAKSIGLPQNQDTLTLALVCHMGIDVSHVDNKIKANNSKALNRYVSAGRQLRMEAPRDKNGKLVVSFDAEGVASLMTIIADKGGINSLMKTYLDAKKGQAKTDLIPLDGEDLAELRMQRLAQRLSGGNVLIVGLGRRESDNSVQVDEEIKLTAAAKNAIASQFSIPSVEVKLFKELLAVGHCVPEVATETLVNRFDDPEDKSAPRRFAHRHYVFYPGGNIVVSPILSEASVIVEVEPIASLLGEMPIQGHVEFRTQQIASIEANLAGDRADAFDLRAEDATGTKSGVARFILSSQAAVRDKEGKSKTIPLLVQQVYSRSGVFPLALSPFTPKHTFKDADILSAMKEIAASCGDAIKKTKPVTISGSKGKVTLCVGKAEKSVDHSGVTNDFSLHVRADDFSAVSCALADVDITTGITLGIHSEMLVLSFGTKSASYSVHIPRQGIDGTRSNRFMSKLEPQVWPGLALTEDDEAAEAE